MINNADYDCKKIVWLETTDSEIFNSGFVDFVKKYEKRLMDQGCHVPQLELKGPLESAMSSTIELSKETLSLKSIEIPAISNTNGAAVDDAGFDRFLDEWTINATKEARRQWLNMTKRDRALYLKDGNIVSNTSVASASTVSPSVKRRFFGEASATAITRACDKNCASLVKRRRGKPMCSPAKGKKNVMRCPKPVGVKAFPKPKPKSTKKCHKPMVCNT